MIWFFVVCLKNVKIRGIFNQHLQQQQKRHPETVSNQLFKKGHALKPLEKNPTTNSYVVQRQQTKKATTKAKGSKVIQVSEVMTYMDVQTWSALQPLYLLN